jgi:uncharacterized protein YabE (DUF348 family)
MKNKFFYILSMALILSGLSLLGLGSWKQIPFVKEDEKNSPIRSSHVTVLADGKTRSMFSTERLPANLLALAGIPLYPGDRILSDGQPVAPGEALSRASAHTLQVQRMWPIVLKSGPQVQTIESTAATLGKALWEAGIVLHAEDQLTPPAETPLKGPMDVELRTSRELEIKSKEGRIQIRSAADGVGEALHEAGLSLQGLDYSLPDAAAPLPRDGQIRIVRVLENVLLDTTPLPFETETQPLTDLELDSQKIVQSGEFGITARRVRVRLEDGSEVSRQEEAEFVAQEPKPQIIGYGTKIVPYSLDTPDGPIKYWRALNMYAVSYNPTSNGGLGTATGIPLAKGVSAVDISYIPFGTRMYIPGYGIAVAADVGGGVKGRMIDLGYSDDDYVSWHQWVTVYFLWPPPENIVWVIP